MLLLSCTGPMLMCGPQIWICHQGEARSPSCYKHTFQWKKRSLHQEHTALHFETRPEYCTLPDTARQS